MEQLRQRRAPEGQRRREGANEASPDLRIIRTEFAAHLVALGYASRTIGWYQRRLADTAVWLARRNRRLVDVFPRDVPSLLRRSSSWHARKMFRAALHCWLRFRGLESKAISTAPVRPWQSWLERYERFLDTDCGFSANTRIYRRRYARCFLAAQFRCGPVRWEKLRPVDVWRFAERFCRRVRPSSANVMLCSLRSFLRFVHL